MKPVNKKIDKLALKAIFQAEREASLGSAQSSDLSEQRIRAYEYYVGDMSQDMPAPDGESSAVSTDVQDVVEGLLPIILDVLTSGERIVSSSRAVKTMKTRPSRKRTSSTTFSMRKTTVSS